ncbi:hypothetical protein FPCIR_14103 [Fusarium pseudocircinatum]|uniref:Uncharacterized protein n=1 Tax=Fusarium pseudocircinatum TaxID=56676 RepID=A0A8H5NQA6_9HYPO|nr:hypothetical protein FPCIR_14103 [Fusarium pseudocircinatum]
MEVLALIEAHWEPAPLMSHLTTSTVNQTLSRHFHSATRIHRFSVNKDWSKVEMSYLRDLATEAGSSLTATGDSEQSGARPGPQIGQPNLPAQGARNGGLIIATPQNRLGLSAAEGAIGQLGGGIINLSTDDLARSGIHMTMTTPVGEYRITFNSGEGTTLSQVIDAAYSVGGPGQVLSGHITMINVKDWLDKNAKRKRLPLDDEDDEDEEEVQVRRSARRTREAALFKLADQRDSGQGSGQDQGRTDDNSQRWMFCVGCKSNKHTLAVCLKAGADGFMKGCPFCDTMGHGAGSCPHQALKDNKKLKVYHFVFKRRNMPSFLNIKAWYPLVDKNIAPHDLAADSRFPWTPEFTNSNAGRIDELQRKVDEKGLVGAKLPVDPTVKGWSAVVAYCESLKREDQEKALAKARAKVKPSLDAQKALAAMMNMSDEPDASWLVAELGCQPGFEPAPAEVQDERGASPVLEKEPVDATKDESGVSALAKKQQVQSRFRPSDRNSGYVEYEADSDDDLDNEELVRKYMKRERAKRIEMAIRANNQASKQ